MAEENPYESPSSGVEEKTTKPPAIQYKSWKEAFIANFIRWAKIGGLGMLACNALIFAVLWTFILFKIIRKEFSEGIDLRFILYDKDLQRTFVDSIITFIMIAIIYSFACGSWMGFISVLSYKFHKNGKNQNQQLKR